MGTHIWITSELYYVKLTVSQLLSHAYQSRPFMFKFDDELVQKQRVNLQRRLWRCIWNFPFSAHTGWLLRPAQSPNLTVGCGLHLGSRVSGRDSLSLLASFFLVSSFSSQGLLSSVRWWRGDVAVRPGWGPWVFTVQTGPRLSWKEHPLVLPPPRRHDQIVLQEVLT